MKYLLMCCHEEKKMDAMSKGECDSIMDETSAYCEALQKSGHLIAAEPPESSSDGRDRASPKRQTVYDRRSLRRKRRSRSRGFFLSTPKTSTRPSQVASKFPSVRFGSMEVRPVMEPHGCSRPAGSS
jgi:hypothetical protein